jgi:acetyl esterase/lipase
VNGGTAGVKVYRDVVFSRPVGFRPISLDLYVPAGPTSTLCLYLHGGGWRVGTRADGPGISKTWTPSFFEQVAAAGLAIASIDYRLSGEAHYPAQQNDVSEAARFLVDNAADFDLSFSRTVTWGVSAGGHLAAMHALTSDPPAEAAVCWYTPTDLDQLSHDVESAGGVGERGLDSREGQLLGTALDARPDLVSAASPVTQVTAKAPPFLFFNGTADTQVPPQQSSRLADAILAAGGEASIELIEGATHMFPELDSDQLRVVIDRSVEFLLQA